MCTVLIVYIQLYVICGLFHNRVYRLLRFRVNHLGDITTHNSTRTFNGTQLPTSLRLDYR